MIIRPNQDMGGKILVPACNGLCKGLISYSAYLWHQRFSFSFLLGLAASATLTLGALYYVVLSS